LLDPSGLDEPRLAPFRDALREWLDRNQAQAVLVRPDHYVFGTGRPEELASEWAARLSA
jgi:3-(3-hydroxy-phenyl)propionate hydroxylase